MLRAAHARADASPTVAALLLEVRTLLRAQIRETFGPEISSRGSGGPILLETLGLAGGWPSWEVLRSQASCSAAAAEQIMVHNFTELLQ